MNFRIALLPGLLLGLFGACLGFHYGCQASDWVCDGLVSSTTLALYCPLWALSGPSWATLLSLVQALQGAALLGFAAWYWPHSGLPQLRAGARSGLSLPEARKTTLQAAFSLLFLAVLTGLWTSTFVPRLAHPALQLLGVVNFLPTLWALRHHQQLRDSLLREKDRLEGREFRQFLALGSPIVVAPALCVAFPGFAANVFLYCAQACWAARLTGLMAGPYLPTLLGGAGMGCLGLLLGGPLALRPLAVTLGVALLSCHPAPPSRLAPLEPVSDTYRLVPLDPALAPRVVQVHGQGHPALQWSPSAAYAELAQHPTDWYQVQSVILDGLGRMRPSERAAILPAHLNRIYASQYLHGGKLYPPDREPRVNRLSRPETRPLHRLRGSVEMDGRPAANVPVRLTLLPANAGSSQYWMGCRLDGEVRLGLRSNPWPGAVTAAAFSALVRTDANGRFDATGLLPGTYELTVRMDGAGRVELVDGCGAVELTADRELAPVRLHRI